ACPTSTCPSSGIRSRRGTTGACAWPPATPSIATRSTRRRRWGSRVRRGASSRASWTSRRCTSRRPTIPPGPGSCSPRREKKLKGVIMGLGAPAGNAATRIEVYVTKNGIYSSGVVPEIEDLFQRQARELDRKKREALLHQIQDIMVERVMHVPIYELAFLWGVGPRVEEAA